MKMGRLLNTAVIGAIVLFCYFSGCGSKGSGDAARDASMKNKSIEQVLKENTNQWMSIPGVEGIAIGEYKGKSCIRVFTSIDPQNLQSKIPSNVEGYPVIVEKTGPFGALEQKK